MFLLVLFGNSSSFDVRPNPFVFHNYNFLSISYVKYIDKMIIYHIWSKRIHRILNSSLLVASEIKYKNLPFNQIPPVDPHRKTAGHSVGILPSPSSLYQSSLKSRSHGSWSEVPRAYSTDLVGSFKIWLSVQGSWAPIPKI